MSVTGFDRMLKTVVLMFSLSLFAFGFVQPSLATHQLAMLGFVQSLSAGSVGWLWSGVIVNFKGRSTRSKLAVKATAGAALFLLVYFLGPRFAVAKESDYHRRLEITSPVSGSVVSGHRIQVCGMASSPDLRYRFVVTPGKVVSGIIQDPPPANSSGMVCGPVTLGNTDAGDFTIRLIASRTDISANGPVPIDTEESLPILVHRSASGFGREEE